MLNEGRFLPGPLPLKQTKQNGSVVSVDDPAVQFSSIFVPITLSNAIRKRSALKI